MLGHGLVDAGGGDGYLCQRFRLFLSQLFDFHAAFYRTHRQVLAVGAVQQDREVVFLVDICTGSHHHAVDRVPLDVHSQDRVGVFKGLVRRTRQFHPASLAAATGFHLGLDDSQTGAQLRESGFGFFGGVGNFARQNRNLVLGKQIACLVFVKIHAVPSLVSSLRHISTSREHPQSISLRSESVNEMAPVTSTIALS